MKILLVADTPWVVNDVKAAIIDRDTTLVQVEDPTQVVATLADEQPEIVVVDMQVKSMGSMAVVRQIRDATAAGKIFGVPIVMLLDREADLFLAKRSGAEAALRKPFTAQDLRRAITLATANPGFEARDTRAPGPENAAD